MKKLKFGKFNVKPIKQGVYGGLLCKGLDEAIVFAENKLALATKLPAEAVLVAPVALAIAGSALLKPKAGSVLDDAITGAIIVGTGRIIDYAWDLGKAAMVKGYPYNSGYPSQGVAGYPSEGVAAYPYSQERATA